MLSVIILRKDIPQVIQLTEENIMRELQTVVGAELMLEDSWLEGVKKVRNTYTCLLEPDCLVSSGYFSSMMGLFKNNIHFKKLAMLSSATAVEQWFNRIFGYNLHKNKRCMLEPVRKMQATSPYPIQVGWVPGAIIRTSALKDILPELEKPTDLKKFSLDVAMKFWNTSRMVYINPIATYCTTQKKAGQAMKCDPQIPKGPISVFQESK